MTDSPREDRAALRLEISGSGVAWLVFDRPGARVNILTSAVMARLDALLGDIENGVREQRIRAVVVRSGKDGTFIVGADVNEIVAITDATLGAQLAAEGQRVLRRLDRLAVPTVAAVDGICLGGGLELVLACDAHIASDRPETKLGLPEVKLGIIPGFGGTVRLPRVVGTREALGMILTGGTVSARKAQRIGLISERMHPSVLYPRAETLALEMSAGPGPKRIRKPLFARALDDTRLGRRLVLAQARRQVLKETGGHYPAPLRALEVVRETAKLPLDDALRIEARALGDMIVTDVSKNLIHVFNLLEGAKKAGPRAVAARHVERAGVLGAGVMGGGIAQLLAYRGIEVRLKDIRNEALALGLKHARDMFDRLVQRGRLEKRELERYMDAIAPTLDYSGFGTVDLVIEAVVERLDIKQQVLTETEQNVDEACVLTTNTSSLSVTDMQSVLARPARFAGMHFFNPVHRMPLVEVIRGARTSDETIAMVIGLTRQLDKTPVIVNDGPGFLVNRILAPYLNEAGWLAADGASIEQIDRTLTQFGMPMGPLRLLDEVGLDVARHAGAVMSAAFGERLQPPPMMTALASTDLLGRKGGRGFYLYEDGRDKGVNREIYARLGLALGAQRRPLPEQQILDRTLLAMVNEAARILEDGIVATAGDVDLGMITGTGFPPFRGGLLRWADTLGMPEVLRRLESLAQQHGPRFTPAPLMRARAAQNRSFYDAPDEAPTQPAPT
ncbi:MAG TPA: 3-hydroxyacyl-CoA dehydrogenase NAD-binding domain-containing protein [Longimicrobiales bacterium]|nr:3-hydroxyacyl-CoA dehydrogenase NAD-binding domain-containing protein [Longimicrobiales bacterium]